MNKFVRVALLATAIAGTSFAAQSAQTTVTPVPSQDPIVQHLKLSSEQVSKIESLHQQLGDNISKISEKDIKDGALIGIIQSGKWNESAVKKQLTAFSKIDQQARYYKVKYYFDLSQVLTPEQRQLVQNDLVKAATE
ncbi:hypothetical protein FH968_07785 [Buttiauxella sp. B2]|uniref:Spy/CpxP family protein refolding chaperone n=1 Tax=Buttiauxella sp. B2 TaxID=2587812 RepID=UPI001120B49D|nr:hypothetical protein [Buttiauxella sp. B2]TNV21330.1 hypothetical protein FH968_07785 [Buttiauxella sp. B2]